MYKKFYIFAIAALLVLQSVSIISARQSGVSNNKAISVTNFTDVTGKWNVTAVNDGQEIPVVFELKQDGEDVTGKVISAIGGGDFSNGKVKDDDISGVVNIDVQGQAISLKLEAKVEGNKIKGTMTSDLTGAVPFSGSKAE